MASVVHGKLLYRQVSIVTAKEKGFVDVNVEISIYKSNITDTYWIEQVMNGEKSGVFLGQHMIADMLPMLTEISQGL